MFWKLSFIFAYIFISLIFSIILSPINKKLISYRINKTISSLFCLLIIFFVVISFGFLLYPLIYEEIKIINSNLNTNSFTNFINQFIYNTNEYLLSYGIDSQIKSDDIISLLPITSFTTLFDSIFSILGNMFLASFSILL